MIFLKNSCRLLFKTLKNRNHFIRKYCISHSQENLYDIVICGGGMVGAAFTAAIAQDPLFRNHKVMLIEASEKKELKSLPPVYANRTCALNLTTRKFLEDIGAWKHIEGMRYQPWKKMQVWENCSDAVLSFSHDDMTQDLAYLVENDVILEAINRQLSEKTVDLRFNCKVKEFKLPQENSQSAETWVHIHLLNGETIKTRLLIAADGYNSQIRKTAGIHTVEHNYKQKAVVATMQLSEPTDNNVAWQRFLPSGPIALLPIADSHSCLVWSTSQEEAKRLIQLEPDTFVDAVNHAFWSDDKKDPVADYMHSIFDGLLSTVGLGRNLSHQLPPTVVAVEDGTRGAFPLGLCHATHYVKKRIALIGDSAHRIHPMAGQGVNLGFGDVICLKYILSKAILNGNDIGSLHYLLQYESERQRHIIPTVALTDGLSFLYGTTWSPIVLLRSLGLQIIDSIPPLKEQLVKHATG